MKKKDIIDFLKKILVGCCKTTKVSIVAGGGLLTPKHSNQSGSVIVLQKLQARVLS